MDIAGKNFNKVLNLNVLLPIWLGKVEWFSAEQKFWLNPDVGTSFETIWDAGGNYNWIGTASVLDVKSNSVNDTSAGTGARTIMLYGLDANFEPIEEMVTLNGTTIVTTTKAFKRIHRMRVLTAWSQAKAEGTITAQIGATVHAQIIDGNNQSLMAVYTIPAGYTGLILKGKASCGKGKEVEVNFRGREFWGVFGLYHSFYIYEDSYEYEFWVPLRVPEKTDIYVEAKSDVATKVSAVFDIVLIKN